MKKSTFALQKFQSFNCAQAVFSSFANELKIDENTALRLASGFGGGMARGETCGAVTASYLVIGMKHGHVNPGPLEKENTKMLIRKFNERFMSEHGSLICKELIGCDISNPEGHEKAKEKDAFNQFCPKFIASACDILEEGF
jgi:C_GCAxxG_C_C family probable redox protein